MEWRQGDELPVDAELLDHLGADAGHDVHVADHIRAVRDLDADLGDGRTDGSHGKGDDVQGAAPHAALVEAFHGGLELPGSDPVVCRTGVVFFGGADVGPRLDPGHVARRGAEEEAVGLFGKGDRHAAGHHLIHQAVILLAGAVAPVDGVGLAHFGDFPDPSIEFLVFRHHSVLLSNRGAMSAGI